MVINNKILILTSGKVEKLNDFKNKNVDLGSFDDINFDSDSNVLRLKTVDLKQYALIYFRIVGKSLEIATLVTNYATKNNIQIVDKTYTKSNLMPVSLGKSIEMKKLIEAGIKIPKTYLPVDKLFLDKIKFPYVVKSTTSSRAREVWLVKDKGELEKLKSEKFKKGKFYFAQEFIPKAKRARLLIIDNRVIGGILRYTKWNKDETKETLNPVPEDMAKLAIEATKAVGLDISGVDLLTDENDNLYVIEVNAAPSWKLINKYCGVIVEDEIVKYLQTKI